MNSPVDTGVNFGAKDLLMSGGVSRSGRVRKKSTKLLNYFQPPEEIEKKPKRTHKHNGRRGRMRLNTSLEFDLSNDIDMEPLPDLSDLVALNACPVDLGLDVKLLDEAVGITGNNSDAQMVSNQALLDNFLNTAPDSEDELDNLVADLVEGVEAESLQKNKDIDTNVHSSIYMMEKTKNRRIIRDGKIITNKLQRKDKGKPRCTAYSLWASEFRKSNNINNPQELDSPKSVRRLGELWANVPNKDKNNWRRKAKQMSVKTKEIEGDVCLQQIIANPITTATAVTSTYNTPFLNRATTNRTRKLAEAAQAAAATAAETNANNKSNNQQVKVEKRQRVNNRKNTNRNQGEQEQQQKEPLPIKEKESKEELETEPKQEHQEREQLVLQDINLLASDVNVSQQPPGTKAIDAAAHLKLLGESLAIIGKRLKEHDGQIAMSGSLSVLLDSVLCSLGPLMCLTTYLPGLENNEHLQKNLASILDNIAYVMPGL